MTTIIPKITPLYPQIQDQKNKIITALESDTLSIEIVDRLSIDMVGLLVAIPNYYINYWKSLANDFQVSSTTMARWFDGTPAPSIHIRKNILRWLITTADKTMETYKIKS